MASEYVIAHELAHQWFGDSVSLENWKDIWLKEGIATYAGWLWDAKNDLTALSRIAEEARQNFQDSDASVAEPPPNNLYSNESYTGGALVFHALRLHVGDEIFFQILKTYAERYRYGVAGTDEFIAIAEEISDQDLKEFFDQWLFGTRMPEVPG
jgi:aminopeptidase N